MNKTHKSIFDNFNELSTNVVNEDFDKAKEFLADLGMDVVALGATGENEFKKSMFLSKAKANQSHDLSLIVKLKEKIVESVERNASMVNEILKNTLHQQKASFQFRNLDKLTDDELREVLGDIDLSKLLEDLEDMED